MIITQIMVFVLTISDTEVIWTYAFKRDTPLNRFSLGSEKGVKTSKELLGSLFSSIDLVIKWVLTVHENP